MGQSVKMLRLRKSNGEVIGVQDKGTFVELSDPDGKVLMAFLPLESGIVLQISPGGQDALRYEEMFSKQQVKFVR